MSLVGLCHVLHLNFKSKKTKNKLDTIRLETIPLQRGFIWFSTAHEYILKRKKKGKIKAHKFVVSSYNEMSVSLLKARRNIQGVSVCGSEFRYFYKLYQQHITLLFSYLVR